MVKYPSTNIFLRPLDDKTRESLDDIESYLNINGKLLYENIDNPKRIETYYFMGNSVVKIITLKDEADIKIMASSDNILLDIKSKLERILNKGLK
jgi:hypothetical protein